MLADMHIQHLKSFSMLLIPL